MKPDYSKYSKEAKLAFVIFWITIALALYGLFFGAVICLADVTVPSSATDVYSHQDFNRASIYKLRNLYLGDSSDYTLQLKAPDTLSDDDTVFQLPGDNGTDGYYLQTDGSGVTSWNELDVSDDSNAATTLGLSSSDDVEHQSLDLSGTAGAGFLELKHQSSEPSAPSGANDLRLFVDTKKLKYKDSAGVTQEVGSGAGSGGGGINILANASANWDFENGDDGQWTETGTSTFTADDTAADVFLGTYSGKWDAGASGEYLTGTAVTIPNALNSGSVVCLLEFYYKGADANIDFYAYDGSSAVTGSSDTLSASTDWVRAHTTFTCPSSGTLTLRLESSADAAAIYIDNVKIGTSDIISIPDPRGQSYDESEVTITGSTSPKAEFVPYQTSSGTWRMKFNLEGTNSAGASATIAFTGTTFPAYNQAIAADIASDSLNFGKNYAVASSSPGQIIVTASGASFTTHRISGDIALASKPTWATKTAPDVYLGGKVNVDEVALDLSDDSPSVSISTSWADIVYPSPTTNEDTHNGYDTSTGGYTIPYDGWYTITGTALVVDSGTASANEYAQLGFEVNSTIINQTTNFAGGGEQYLPLVLSGTFYLNKDDVVKWQVKSNLTGASLSSSAVYNHKSIVKTPSPQEVANAALTFSQATEDRPGLISSEYEWSTTGTTEGAIVDDFVLKIIKIGNVCHGFASSDRGTASALDYIGLPAGTIPESLRPSTNQYSSVMLRDNGDEVSGIARMWPDGSVYFQNYDKSNFSGSTAIGSIKNDNTSFIWFLE